MANASGSELLRLGKEVPCTGHIYNRIVAGTRAYATRAYVQRSGIQSTLWVFLIAVCVIIITG